MNFYSCIACDADRVDGRAFCKSHLKDYKNSDWVKWFKANYTKAKKSKYSWSKPVDDAPVE